MSHDDPGRREQVETGLRTVTERIENACKEVRRDASDITLVVVTKFFPASDVRLLAELGVRDVGENRHQEAAEKEPQCTDLDLTWHFIGGLQSNKAAAVPGWADVVHSVDRAKLVNGLSRGAVERGRTLDCLVQVSLDPPGAAGRSGCEPADVPALVERIQDAEGLRLRGVMGVAPLGGGPAEAFARLAEHAADVRRQEPGATWLSAGMSADLEEAVRAGATHLRIGSAVLGPRPRVQ
ncbi:MAG TPA: YggS family pyridoxal phosphate-dependent enzyme [Marmoricola sp.]|nr:YggS family pyridoxal phosphate-dependent enzyme [Marmoricola sp.]